MPSPHEPARSALRRGALSARAAILTALGGLVAACLHSPTLPNAGDTPEEGPAFADAILVSAQGELVESCGEGLGCPPAPACAAHPALGEPDGEVFTLGPGDRLEVGFLCSAILDGADEAPADFKIWSEVPPGSRALVSVGYEAGEHLAVETLTVSDGTFDLARVGLGAARFVQIVHDEGEPIEIDAIEAFRAPGS